MKKILFFTLPFWGHINPNKDLITNLGEKYDVVCVSSEKFKQFFHDIGLEIIEYPNFISEYYGDGVINDDESIVKKYYSSQFNTNDMSAMSKKSIEVLEKLWFELGSSIKDFNPDLIINDVYAFWGRTNSKYFECKFYKY